MKVQSEPTDHEQIKTLSDKEALSRLNAQLESIIEALPGMVAVVDREFNTLLANSAVIKRFGQSDKNQVIGQKCYRVRKNLDDICPECGVAKAFETGKIVTRASTPDEEALMGIATQAYAVPVRDENGEIWACVEAIMDISEIRRNQVALEEQTQRLQLFKSAVECSSQAVGMSSSEGKHWYGNKAFVEMFGNCGEDPPASVYVDEEQGREIFETLMSGREWKGEVEMYDKDHRILNVLLHADAIKDDEGKVIALLGVHSDLSDSKTAQEERIQLIEQIHKSQKLESLGVLAGGIAHDFNNLLGGIYGYIEMAMEETNPAVISRYLSKSLNTIDRARALTRQLLTFSKGGAPIKEIKPLFPLVKETVEFALSGSNVTCEFECNDSLWTCSFDANQISQAIDNIIINSKQAMPQGGAITALAQNVTLEQGQIVNLPKGPYVKIEISDTGIGMPSNILPNIFDPFFTTKQMGSGLGLTTAYSIVKRHGGEIDVSSVPGEGSAFTIYLPAHAQARTSVLPTEKTPANKNGRILIMDDEEVILEFIEAVCRTLGYEIACETNGDDAIKNFELAQEDNDPFKAVILDLTIPGGKGGKETLKELREMSPDTPVFVSSGYADDPVMANPGDHGFTDSICKPFRRRELVDMLDKYLTD